MNWITESKSGDGKGRGNIDSDDEFSTTEGFAPPNAKPGVQVTRPNSPVFPTGKAMSVNRIFIPRQTRSFTGKRWVFITLRTLHLIGVAGLGGGFLYDVPQSVWMPYLQLTIASGSAILLLEIWSNGIYFIQLRGFSTVVKLLVLLSIPLLDGYEFPLFLFIIVISGVMSHAPAYVRYYSVFHRRRIDEL